MGFSRLNFSKLWTNPTDFPTVELDEAQVRADLQALHDEAKAALNSLMTALEAKTAAASVGAKAKDGSTKSTVQKELDALNALIVAAGNLPGGGTTGQFLKKNSETNFDAAWVDLKYDSLAYLGVRAIDSFEEDTVANWQGKGTGYSYYYNNPSALADQPSERGFLFNTTQGSYVVQEWIAAATGEVYRRVGNTASGWLTSWVQSAAKDYVDNTAAGLVKKAGDTMTGNLSIARSVPGLILNHTNGKGAALQMYNNAVALSAYDDNTDTSSGYRRIRLQSAADQSDVAQALVLMDLEQGETDPDPYPILHTGNLAVNLGASKIVTGTYTGNSATNNNILYEQTITLGFTPKLVAVFTEDGETVSALPGSDYVETSDCTALKVVTGGFTAAYYYNDPANGNSSPKSYGINYSGEIYRYIAIG